MPNKEHEVASALDVLKKNICSSSDTGNEVKVLKMQMDRIEEKIDALLLNRAYEDPLDVLDKMLSKPIESIEDFDKFEKFLYKDDEKRKMIAGLCRLPCELSIRIKTYMRRLMAPEVMCQFTLEGKRTKKRSFIDTELYSVIYEALEKTNRTGELSSYDKTIVTKEMTLVLSNATRQGGVSPRKSDETLAGSDVTLGSH